MPTAGAEGAARVEAARARRGSRSARDRSRRHPGLPTFLPNHRMRAARSKRAARRGVAFCHAQTGLKGRLQMVSLVTTPRLMAVGGGALAELPAMLRRLGLDRPLVVTDPYIASCGIFDQATALLESAQIRCSVFSETVPDPTTTVVETGTRLLVEGGFDSLIALGGGSSI